MMKLVERLARKTGLDIERVKGYGLDTPTARIETVSEFNK